MPRHALFDELAGPGGKHRLTDEGGTPSYPAASGTITVYVGADGTVWAYSNALNSQTAILQMDIGGHDYFLSFVSGSVTGHAIFSVGNDPSNPVSSGESINYVYQRKSDSTYLGGASWDPGTVQTLPGLPHGGQHAFFVGYVWTASGWSWRTDVSYPVNGGPPYPPLSGDGDGTFAGWNGSGSAQYIGWETDIRDLSTGTVVNNAVTDYGPGGGGYITNNDRGFEFSMSGTGIDFSSHEIVEWRLVNALDHSTVWMRWVHG